MTELPDYNKIVFPEMPPIPLETIVPDASPEVGWGTVYWGGPRGGSGGLLEPPKLKWMRLRTSGFWRKTY